MRDNADKYRGKASIAVIVPHDVPRVKFFWEKEKIPFPGLPDPEGRLGKLYSQQWNPLKLGRMPALFIIDRRGKIAFAHYGGNMADIPTGEEILSIVDSLNKAAS